MNLVLKFSPIEQYPNAWLIEHPSIAAITVLVILSGALWVTSKLRRKPASEDYLIEVVRGKWVLRDVAGTIFGPGGSKKSMVKLASECLRGRGCKVHVRNRDGSEEHSFMP